MGRYSKGDVVIVDFPFTDQSGIKRRPALVVMAPPGTNVVIVQMTSQDRGPYPIPITQADLKTGILNRQSYLQPDVIVTINEAIISGKAGSLTGKKLTQVIDKIIELLRS